jgi:hypothetical protein
MRFLRLLVAFRVLAASGCGTLLPGTIYTEDGKVLPFQIERSYGSGAVTAMPEGAAACGAGGLRRPVCYLTANRQARASGDPVASERSPRRPPSVTATTIASL